MKFSWMSNCVSMELQPNIWEPASAIIRIDVKNDATVCYISARRQEHRVLRAVMGTNTMGSCVINHLNFDNGGRGSL
jgi:hypothetical protein